MSTKISALTAVGAAAAANEFVINEAGTTKKMSLTQLMTLPAGLALTPGTGGIALAANGLVRTGRERFVPAGAGKIAAATGWVEALTTALPEVTLAAGITAKTFIIPLVGLTIGDTVTAFKLLAQIEATSSNTVTMDADLRKFTNAAADPVDASIGAITQVSVTGDTAVAAAKTGLAEVVAAGEALYVLVTATTGATTDIKLLGITYTVTEA